MDYEKKEVDRYYVISEALRDLGYRGSGDRWFREGFGPYSFDFLAVLPSVRLRLRRLRYEKTRDSIVRVWEKMRVDMQPFFEAAREANSVMRKLNEVYAEQSEEDRAEEKALTDFGKRQAQRIFDRQDREEAREEMIANLDRGRLRAEVMDEIIVSRRLGFQAWMSERARDITVHVQGHGGRQYFKQLMPYPDGTLPSSALFDPDNPLSGGWRERKGEQ